LCIFSIICIESISGDTPQRVLPFRVSPHRFVIHSPPANFPGSHPPFQDLRRGRVRSLR
jgi:hypothetical protein